MIWIALGLGAAAAVAALYGHYRVLPAWLTGPEVCLMEDGGCAVLFRSPRARLLGVPNALLGVMLYLLLAIGLVLKWPEWLLFVMTLPYSDAVFVQAFPRECTEAFQEGHKRAFQFFGAAATRISL